jgi:hypothetical protein
MSYAPINRMVEIATNYGEDVLTYGIPTDIFIAEWVNEYGMDMPEGFVEEIEREYKNGLSLSVAADYWSSLDSWFTDFVADYQESLNG